jgi:lichenan operon transcriptional antiterminator
VNVPETRAERISYLLLKLISIEQPISIYELTEELFISESTLLNDIKLLKKKCSSHSLEIKYTKNTLQLLGTEKAKRQLIHTTLLAELDNNFGNITKLQESFSDFDLDYIKEIVAEIFSNDAFFTNDYALTNIVIHLAIAIDRMKNNFQFPKSEMISSQSIPISILEIAEKIAENVSLHYDIYFSKEEIRDLSLLIAANGTNINFTQISIEELKRIIDERCLNLVEKILTKVRELYFIDNTEPEFYIRFALHMKNLLYRLNNDYTIRNPMTETLKKECPLIYDCAVQVSHMIQEELAYTINEDEIAYIAFHLGYALEVQKQRTTKIKCVVLVPLYYNMNIQVLEKLQKNFADDLDIQNILTNEKELQFIDTELIISAVKLKQVVTIPYVIINPFFTLENRQQITEKIFDIKQQKRKDIFSKNFLSIASKEHFLYTTENLAFDELLQQLCKKMEADGMVDESFFSQVMAREELSSTAYGAVAIPHSLTMNAKQTCISIVANPNGIQWHDNRVTLIFLISINYLNRHVFREIFDNLAMICSEENNIQKLSQITSFDSFTKELIECCTSN